MEQISIFDMDCQKPYKIKKPMRLIELFGGIGSQAKALENLKVNFEHYRLCEFDKYAVQSYNAVHGTNFKTSDITKTKAADLGITETDKYEYIMAYSFPCQDLSIAGKQSGMAKGSGTRSGLLWEVERLLKECVELPQVLLMENVPQVLNCDFVGWLEFLESKGYHNYYKCLNAKNFGIPQNRERCFMVSVLGNYYYDFPKEIPLKLRLKDMLESKVDEKYYLSPKLLKFFTSLRKAGINTEQRLEIGGEVSNALTTVQKDNLVVEPRIFDMYNHNEIKTGICGTITANGNTSSTHCGTFGIVEPIIVDDIYNNREPREYGDTAPTLRSERQGLKVVEQSYVGVGVHPISKKLEFDGYHDTNCPTLLATDYKAPKTILYSNYRIRKLTPKECWRLMGFDDSDFDKAKASGVSNSQLYKQAGNSIVVPVLEAIFRNLF